MGDMVRFYDVYSGGWFNHLASIKHYQGKADVLFHEMIHQFLFENNENAKHDSKEWCREIMRLGKEIWDYDFFASPTKVRKQKLDDGTLHSVRKQDEGSISRTKIARFPQSLNLNINVENYLEHEVVITEDDLIKFG